MIDPELLIAFCSFKYPKLIPKPLFPLIKPALVTVFRLAFRLIPSPKVNWMDPVLVLVIVVELATAMIPLPSESPPEPLILIDPVLVIEVCSA